MRLFRDKAREEFLENEIKMLVESRQNLAEKNTANISELERQLDINRELEEKYLQEKSARESLEVYKADNVTLIERVGVLSGHIDSLKNELAAVTNANQAATQRILEFSSKIQQLEEKLKAKRRRAKNRKKA